MRKATSVVLLTLLLTSVLTLAFNIQPVKASGTIYIMADGSVNPPATPIQRDGDLYTFTDDIYDEIVVQKSNIVIDGNGSTLQGSAMPEQTGFYIDSVSNVTIKNTTIQGFFHGITLSWASDCRIIANSIAGNTEWGVALFESSDNIISGNSIVNTTTFPWPGIWIAYLSIGNTISNNYIADNTDGIWIGGYGAEFNTISGNIIINNNDSCIYIWYASNNTIRENYLANAYVGVWVDCYESWIPEFIRDNRFYHNAFINNTLHVLFRDYIFPNNTSSDVNIWDDGYPSGGNYWSDYSGFDFYSGSNQNEVGSDGIGDTPYVIDENNTDRYPLMGPWTVEGENITVIPSTEFTVTFESIDSPGITTLVEAETGQDPPFGFKVIQYYDIETTAEYSGTITIRITYDDSEMTQEEEEDLQLMQWNETTLQWVDITTTLDTQTNIIIGETTHLSMFSLMSLIPNTWEYVFEDTKRGTMLKISTDDQYFQFVAPDKEFAAKHDPHLQIREFTQITLITICYEDGDIKLAAFAIAGERFDSCTAFAKDIQTGRTYILIDQPNRRGGLGRHCLIT